MFLAGLSAAHAASWSHQRVTLFDEAIGVPGTALVTTPLHPGVTLGTSIVSGGGEHLQHRLQLDVGGYLHRPVEHAVFALPSWQGTWWPAQVVGVSLLAGVGYKHSFYATPTWIRRDGVWVRSVRGGRPEVTGQVGLGVDVRVDDRWSVVVQHRGSADGPFSAELAPAMLHLATHLGLEYRR